MSDQPEKRVITTVQALQTLGINASTLLLVAVCSAFVVFAMYWVLVKDTQASDYGNRMLVLVSNIQNQLEKNIEAQEKFRRQMVESTGKNSRDIATLQTLLETLGYWPLHKDGERTYIQTPVDRDAFYSDPVANWGDMNGRKQ